MQHQLHLDVMRRGGFDRLRRLEAPDVVLRASTGTAELAFAKGTRWIEAKVFGDDVGVAIETDE
jgi:hypothetical protein